MLLTLDRTKLKWLMCCNGFSMCRLAFEAGLHESTVSRAVNLGTCRPDTGKLIADALGVRLSEILKPLEEEK